MARLQTFHCESCGARAESSSHSMGWIRCQYCGGKAWFDPVDHRAEVKHTHEVVHTFADSRPTYSSNPADAPTPLQDAEGTGAVCLVFCGLFALVVVIVVWADWFGLLIAAVSIPAFAVMCYIGWLIISSWLEVREANAQERWERKQEIDPAVRKRKMVVVTTIVISAAVMAIIVIIAA